MPGVLAPYYHLPRELDVRPKLVSHVEPQYPEGAALRGVSGTVVVRLYIGESGKVDKVDIVRADPPGYFEASAAKAFGAARFTPGTKGGSAARAQMLIEVSFESPAVPIRGATR
jgi:protein TonB